MGFRGAESIANNIEKPTDLSVEDISMLIGNKCHRSTRALHSACISIIRLYIRGDHIYASIGETNKRKNYADMGTFSLVFNTNKIVVALKILGEHTSALFRFMKDNRWCKSFKLLFERTIVLIQL